MQLKFETDKTRMKKIDLNPFNPLKNKNQIQTGKNAFKLN